MNKLQLERRLRRIEEQVEVNTQINESLTSDILQQLEENEDFNELLNFGYRVSKTSGIQEIRGNIVLINKLGYKKSKIYYKELPEDAPEENLTYRVFKINGVSGKVTMETTTDPEIEKNPILFTTLSKPVLLEDYEEALSLIVKFVRENDITYGRTPKVSSLKGKIKLYRNYSRYGPDTIINVRDALYTFEDNSVLFVRDPILGDFRPASGLTALGVWKKAYSENPY